MIYRLYADGGARGNPGPAASGYFLFGENDDLVDYGGEYLGEVTNNQAEYKALLSGLKLAHKRKVTELEIFMDSELIVKQVLGEYKVKDAQMREFFVKVKAQLEKFVSYKIIHVKRNKNYFADRMVNIILDSTK